MYRKATPAISNMTTNAIAHNQGGPSFLICAKPLTEKSKYTS